MGSPGSRSRFTCVRFRYAVAYRMQRLYIHNGQTSGRLQQSPMPAKGGMPGRQQKFDITGSDPVGPSAHSILILDA